MFLTASLYWAIVDPEPASKCLGAGGGVAVAGLVKAADFGVIAIRVGVGVLLTTNIVYSANKTSDQITRLQRNQHKDNNGSQGNNEKGDYPNNPDDWKVPEGVSETKTGKITGGRHRRWVDSKGDVVRRWDREGRVAGKPRGPHWHDINNPEGLKYHIEPGR
jgi:hypothetical protein